MRRKLSQFHGRDNNFNLLRMIAALLVINAHAHGITGIMADAHLHGIVRNAEPIAKLFGGEGAGDWGVDIFFVLSGFLIAKSWSGKTWREFAWARVMRIYPALWVSTLLSVVLIALFFYRGSPFVFLASRSTLDYLWHNATMLPHFGAMQKLPGAFGFKDPDFNVSLWTLPYELQMYVLLALVGISVGLRARYMAALVLIGGLIVAVGSLIGVYLLSGALPRFLFFFFSGALAFTLREKVVLDSRIAAILAGLIAASFLASSAVLRVAVLSLSLPYLLLWCAYIPGGVVRLWNHLGDYSYGTYIFAFPVQFGLYATGVTRTPLANMVVSLLIILPLACISWHFLEKRALAMPMPRLYLAAGQKSF